MSDLLMDRRRLLPLLLTAVAIAVGALLVIVLTGDDTGGGASAAAAPSASAGAAGATKIDIADFKFKPADVTVKTGTKVTWTNSDTAPHTATAPDGGFDTGKLEKGQSKTLTVKAGTYSYVCSYHAFMTAKLVVK